MNGNIFHLLKIIIFSKTIGPFQDHKFIYEKENIILKQTYKLVEIKCK